MPGLLKKPGRRRSSQADQEQAAAFEDTMHLSEAARARCPIVKIADGEDLGKFVVEQAATLRPMLASNARGRRRSPARSAFAALIEHHVGRIDASDRRRGGSFNDNTDGLTGAKPAELEHGNLAGRRQAVLRPSHSCSRYRDSSTNRRIVRSGRWAAGTVLAMIPAIACHGWLEIRHSLSCSSPVEAVKRPAGRPARSAEDRD